MQIVRVGANAVNQFLIGRSIGSSEVAAVIAVSALARFDDKRRKD